MNLRRFTLWKRSDKQQHEGDLRSPSSDSGYSDVQPVVPMFPARKPLHPSLGGLHNGDGPSHGMGFFQRHAGQSSRNHSGSRLRHGQRTQPDRMCSGPYDDRATGASQDVRTASGTLPRNIVTVNNFLSFVRDKDLTRMHSAILDQNYDIDARDAVIYNKLFINKNN